LFKSFPLQPGTHLKDICVEEGGIIVHMHARNIHFLAIKIAIVNIRNIPEIQLVKNVPNVEKLIFLKRSKSAKPKVVPTIAPIIHEKLDAYTFQLFLSVTQSQAS